MRAGLLRSVRRQLWELREVVPSRRRVGVLARICVTSSPQMVGKVSLFWFPL